MIRLDAEVWLDTGRGVDRPPERRSVGLVFQEYALFPHMSVALNVRYGARDRARPAELLERLRIGHLADASPAEISGGERQRVALARALARDTASSSSTSRSPPSTRIRGTPCAASFEGFSPGCGCPPSSSRTTSRTPRRWPTWSA